MENHNTAPLCRPTTRQHVIQVQPGQYGLVYHSWLRQDAPSASWSSTNDLGPRFLHRLQTSLEIRDGSRNGSFSKVASTSARNHAQLVFRRQYSLKFMLSLNCNERATITDDLRCRLVDVGICKGASNRDATLRTTSTDWLDRSTRFERQNSYRAVSASLRDRLAQLGNRRKDFIADKQLLETKENSHSAETKSQSTIDNVHGVTSDSTAVSEPHSPLSTQTHMISTPKAPCPSIAVPNIVIQDCMNVERQGFANHIASTPKTLEEVERECAETESCDSPSTAKEDSFIGTITSRSPAKLVPRIEDSLEELDQLEDAIEAIGQVTKAMDSTNRVDGKSEDVTRSLVKTNSKKVSSQPKLSSRTQTLTRTQSLKATSTVASTAKPKPVESTRQPARRPQSLVVPKPPAKSTKPVTRPTFELPGEAVSRRLKEQREARLARKSTEEINKASLPPRSTIVKSMKAPTKPNFELPGEALSRRKREAHEARIKAQEEEQRRKREFKARPVCNTVSNVLPRETVASRARQSRVFPPNSEPAPQGLSVARQRLSVVGSVRSPLQPSLANSSAPRAPSHGSTGLVRKPSCGSSTLSVGAQVLSDRDVQMQRQRAKEIYNRDAKFTEDIERERRERENAAKRSREEAAERGRQASREWAERQRAKKAAVVNAPAQAA